MLQHELTEESQKCKHGYFFGTTCQDCMIERLVKAIGKRARWQYDRMFGVVEGHVYNSKEFVDAIEDIVDYHGGR